MNVHISSLLHRFQLSALIAIAMSIIPTVAIPSVARAAPEQRGLEQRGLEQRGLEQRGPEQRGPEQRGLDHCDPDYRAPVYKAAGDIAPNHCMGDSFVDEAAATPCGFELAATEDLCGLWPDETAVVEAVPTLAPPRLIAKPKPADPTTVCQTMTALATTVCGSAGISVEQIVEPFVMVGPYLNDSLETIEAFQGWWGITLTDIRPLGDRGDEAMDVAMLDDLTEIAAQEPVDIESYGASVLQAVIVTTPIVVETTDPAKSQSDPVPQVAARSGIEITPLNPLVGSSAIVVTIEIEEDYRAYDLSVRDVQLWSVFPVATHPFCVRSRTDDLETPMWKDFDELVTNDTASQVDNAPAETDMSDTEIADVKIVNVDSEIEVDAAVAAVPIVYCGSADCLLDDLVWQAESWAASDSTVRAMMAPRSIGRSIARLISGGNRWVEGAAGRIASTWPEVDALPPQSPSGSALLARAGAVEAAIESVPSFDTQMTRIAEAPVETNRR